MFATSEQTTIQPGVWEQRLTQQKDPLQRLAVIDQLTGHYAYTNVLRAQQLLREQWELLQQHDITDFMFRYFLNTMVVQNQLYEFEKAEQTGEQGIAFLEDAGSAMQLIELYIEYAGVCSNLRDLETAERFLQKAAKALKNFPDQRLFARLACRRGYMHLYSSNFPTATEQFLDALSRLDALGKVRHLSDEYIRSLIFAGLGQVYENMGENEKSVAAFLQVVDLCERLGLANRLAWHYLNVGRAYMGMGQYKKAKVYLQKVIDTRDDLSLEARASAYANLGNCAFEQGRLGEALELLDRAEHLHRELNPNDHYNLSIIANWRGRIHTAQGYFDTAAASFQAAIDLSGELENVGIRAEIYEHYADLCARQGNYEQAYTYQLLYNEYWNAHLEYLDRREQHELEVKYEAAKKEQAAELLELKATQLQLKALRAQMNPHFIYNALNSIQQFITSNDSSTASKYLAKFAKLMRQSLEYSDEESISLEKEIEFLEDYLYINEKLRFEDRLSYKISVDDELEEDILAVPTMIVQPYVENALEHGLRSRKDGLVTVHFYLWDDDTICCTVEDNGVGRAEAAARHRNDPERQNYRSRGTQITEKRLELLRQSKEQEVSVKTIDLYHPETHESTGTRVEILIPIVEIQLK